VRPDHDRAYFTRVMAMCCGVMQAIVAFIGKRAPQWHDA